MRRDLKVTGTDKHVMAVMQARDGRIGGQIGIEARFTARRLPVAPWHHLFARAACSQHVDVQQLPAPWQQGVQQRSQPTKQAHHNPH